MQLLRWRPTTPSALPHVLTQDDRLGEYYFPKGTTFIANAWTIHRNEEEYDRPDEFIPERFLDNPYGVRSKSDAKRMESDGRKTLYTFGSGRRRCPGEQFAVTTVMVVVSKIAWSYDIMPPPEGVDISIETGYEEGTVNHPVNPKVLFKLRDGTREEVLVEDLQRIETIAQASGVAA
jgi:cytochrome P450